MSNLPGLILFAEYLFSGCRKDISLFNHKPLSFFYFRPAVVHIVKAKRKVWDKQYLYCNYCLPKILKVFFFSGGCYSLKCTGILPGKILVVYYIVLYSLSVLPMHFFGVVWPGCDLGTAGLLCPCRKPAPKPC